MNKQVSTSPESHIAKRNNDEDEELVIRCCSTKKKEIKKKEMRKAKQNKNRYIGINTAHSTVQSHAERSAQLDRLTILLMFFLFIRIIIPFP